MTPKEAIEKIKGLFADAMPPAMVEKKTKDGQTITCEGEFKQGAKCAMKMADGTMQVLPDGEYTLEDGTVIMVAQNSITSLVPPIVETEVEMSAPITLESLAKDIAELKAAKAMPATMSAEDKASFDSLKQSLAGLVGKFEAFSATVKEGFKLVSELPIEQPIAAPKNTFKAQNTSERQNRLEGIINSVQKIENNN